MVRFIQQKMTVGMKGQVVIPKIFREAEKIMPGNEVIFELKDEGILIRKKEEKDVIKIMEQIAKSGRKLKKYDSDKGYFLNGESYTYQNEIEKQLCWSAWTVRKNRERFEKNPNKGNFLDFIDFLGNIYCPVGAENDPNRLNANWEKNVREAYAKLKD